MSDSPVLRIVDLRKSFGALRASDNVNLEIAGGEIHAVIGPNGAGKTTLVAQICGQQRPDAGTIFFNGRDITAVPQEKRPALGLVRSFQITSIFPDFTAQENVMMAVQLHAGHSFHFFADAAKDTALTGPALEFLRIVGLEDAAGSPAYALSHGQQRRLELAMALALKPKMLVLDEPMAGMGTEETNHVIALLSQLKDSVTMMLVEHDMDAVFALADRISVLVYGQIIATGSPDEIRNNARVREAYLGDESLADA